MSTVTEAMEAYREFKEEVKAAGFTYLGSTLLTPSTLTTFARCDTCAATVAIMKGESVGEMLLQHYANAAHKPF